jgi:hypothetical protein
MSTGNAIQHVLVMPGLTAIQVKIATYLVGVANGRRRCWASVEEIMIDLGVDSNRTVSTATKVFVERKLLRIVRQRRGPNEYHISDWLYDTPVVLPSRSRRKEDMHRAAHQDDQDMHAAAHQDDRQDMHVAAHQDGQDMHVAAQLDEPRYAAGCTQGMQPAAHPLKTQQDSQKESSKRSLPLTARAPAREVEAVVDYQRIVDAWNEMARATELSTVRDLTGQRRKHLRARLAEHGVEGVLTAISEIGVSSYCHGRNQRGWKAHFDFMLQETSCNRAIEGFYRDRADPVLTVVGLTPSWSMDDDSDAEPPALVMIEGRAVA